MAEKKTKPKYELEEMLKVRERSKDTAEVVRKISNSECGGKSKRLCSSSVVLVRLVIPRYAGLGVFHNFFLDIHRSLFPATPI